MIALTLHGKYNKLEEDITLYFRDGNRDNLGLEKIIYDNLLCGCNKNNEIIHYLVEELTYLSMSIKEPSVLEALSNLGLTLYTINPLTTLFIQYHRNAKISSYPWNNTLIIEFYKNIMKIVSKDIVDCEILRLNKIIAITKDVEIIKSVYIENDLQFSFLDNSQELEDNQILSTIDNFYREHRVSRFSELLPEYQILLKIIIDDNR